MELRLQGASVKSDDAGAMARDCDPIGVFGLFMTLVVAAPKRPR